jgi:hypothetical protein
MNYAERNPLLLYKEGKDEADDGPNFTPTGHRGANMASQGVNQR